jgi:DNA modification methylase
MSLLRADARHIPLADGCVQCVVTSPPYWGLRDYGTATWDGGEASCDHLGAPFRTKATINANCGTGTDRKNTEGRQPMGATCGKCGARRIDQQIGLERTPDAYVAELVAVFREVWRVLRDDGVLWLNLGDTYAGGGGFAPDAPINVKRREMLASGERVSGGFNLSDRQHTRNKSGGIKPQDGIKPKDLVGIPWRVAFALQADGWYLRSDIIWHKPNPMPENVTDRPTKSHEYVFLLTKSERYAYDAKAISEAQAESTVRIHSSLNVQARAGEWKVGEVGNGHGGLRNGLLRGNRNARTVWTIATQPYSGAHFATFPEALVERCVLAGSKARDLVFDPFGGSGTTARVALSLGRRAVATELNPAYLPLARQRTHVTLGLPLELLA